MDLVAEPGVEIEVELERLITLGATRVGIDGADVVMTDPDGNEFRLLPR
jgi:hypothetical protein